MNEIISDKRENVFPENTAVSFHASTVLPLPGGRVAAAAFGGSREGNDDVKIYVNVRENGVWGTPLCISAPLPPQPHWNPVLFRQADGKILLYFKYGKPIAAWRTFVCESADDCKSFSVPRELIPGDESGGRGPVKNKPIRLESGVVLAPASKETKLSWRCFIDRSADDGLSFSRSPFILRPKKNGKPVGMIQPTLWEDKTGVHFFARTNAGKIYRSDSRDEGKTWCKAYETALLNPNSGIDAAVLRDGSLVLTMNPVGENWGNRAPLCLLRSSDGGKTFHEVLKLEAETGDHEFSYPAVTADGMVLHITYTAERRAITYRQIELR